jgi:uncharacterized repeat protein (TIGR01451 family)
MQVDNSRISSLGYSNIARRSPVGHFTGFGIAMGRSYWLMAIMIAVGVSNELSAAGVAHLMLHSQPGDPIGRGEDFDLVFTSQPGGYAAAGVVQTISGQPAYVRIALQSSTLPQYSRSAELEFATNRLGIPLAPGSYPNAQRAPFAEAGFAGLEVSFSSSGCNTLTGSFVVQEAEFGVDLATNIQTVERFVATFAQYCEGSPAALQGSLNFDATATLPDVSITKTHSGDFTQGQTGIYNLTVSNLGSGPTDETVIVTDSLPPELTALSINGAGWSCTLSTVACTRSDAVAAGSSYPAISLTVRATVDAFAFVNNYATVSGGGELDVSNNTARDLTRIWPASPTAATPAPLLGRFGMVLVFGTIALIGFGKLRRSRR